MKTEIKIRQVIDICWTSFKNKVASGLFNPENEKMMHLQFAQILMTLTSLYEYRQNESIKILLEVPVNINRQPSRRIIDIVIQHSENNNILYFPIELKCFRRLTRDGLNNRGARNNGMYDYWMDIENIEQYTLLKDFSFGTQLTLTDDINYVAGRHRGQQTTIYSTNQNRLNITGILQHHIARRQGRIELNGTYSMKGWEQIGDFYFVSQEFKTPYNRTSRLSRQN